MEKFAKSHAFKALEQTHLIGDGLKMREDEAESHLLDLTDLPASHSQEPGVVIFIIGIQQTL